MTRRRLAGLDVAGPPVPVLDSYGDRTEAPLDDMKSEIMYSIDCGPADHIGIVGIAGIGLICGVVAILLDFWGTEPRAQRWRNGTAVGIRIEKCGRVGVR